MKDMRDVKIIYKNVVTGLIYEIIDKLDKTGLRYKMETARDLVVGYKFL